MFQGNVLLLSDRQLIKKKNLEKLTYYRSMGSCLLLQTRWQNVLFTTEKMARKG